MIRLLPLIGILQIICIYLAIKNKVDYWWYFVIIFFPFLGSLAFLYFNFYSRKNIENLQEGAKNIFIENYKIKQLQRNLDVSDTYNNRIQLADEHFNVGNYNQAKEIYDSCRKDIYASDVDLNIKLIESNFALGNYRNVVEIAETIKDDKYFRDSKSKIGYAWSLYESGQVDKAHRVFKEMDINYSNYEQRYEFARFLILTNSSEANELKQKLQKEISQMDSYEKRMHREIIKKINVLV